MPINGHQPRHWMTSVCNWPSLNTVRPQRAGRTQLTGVIRGDSTKKLAQEMSTEGWAKFWYVIDVPINVEGGFMWKKGTLVGSSCFKYRFWGQTNPYPKLNLSFSSHMSWGKYFSIFSSVWWNCNRNYSSVVWGRKLDHACPCHGQQGPIRPDPLPPVRS